MITGLNATLLNLTGGVRLKQRVQHPSVIERKDRGQHYWYFRYREDDLLPNGKIRVRRKFHTVGPSRGEGAVTKKQAELFAALCGMETLTGQLEAAAWTARKLAAAWKTLSRRRARGGLRRGRARPALGPRA